MVAHGSRLGILALGAVVLLLLGPPGVMGAVPPTGMAPAPAGVAFPVPAAATVAPSSAAPSPAVLPVLPSTLATPGNLTLTTAPPRAAARPDSGQPVSAVRVAPAPWVPDTVPTVVTLGTNLKNAGFNQAVSLPNGSWERIILNYTGQVVSSVYDSSYEMWVDSVPVLFGTTPEYGTWTVLQDLTEYSVLLRGTAHLDFRLGDAVIGNGYFLTNLTLSFYPAPAGMPLPVVPSAFVPLFEGSNLVPSRETNFTLASIPNDVANATLEVYEYGFGPNGQDEFWYQDLQTGSTYREITIAADGVPIAADYPFPFINTGGIDLFLWRPVTSVATLENRPQRFDMTADLPLIEGAHNFTVNFTGISPGSSWFVDADLALYLNPNVTGSTLVTHNASVTAFPPVTHGAVLEERGYANFSTESVLNYANRSTVQVLGSLSEMFSANITQASLDGGLVTWKNISQVSRVSGTTRLSGPGGVEYLNRTFAAPFVVDLGTREVLSASTYPLYANVTTSFLHAYQIWEENFSETGPTGATPLRSDLENGMMDANGSWVGEYYVTGPSSSSLINFLNISSHNVRQFQSSLYLGARTLSYTHNVTSVDTGASSATAIPTVTSNAVDSPMLLLGSISRSISDRGAPVTLFLDPLGGRAPFTYEWTALPPGCASTDSAYLVCRPNATGPYPIRATVQDNHGDNASATVGNLLVLADPTAQLAASSKGIDLGETLSINATVLGGMAPFTCAWYLGGVLTAPPGSCSTPFSTTPYALGNLSIALVVTDSEGVNGTVNLTVPAVRPVAVSVVSESGPLRATEPAGAILNLSAEIVGGIGPYNVSWYENGALARLGTTFNVTVGAAGSTERVYATVTDSGSGSNASAPLSITAATAPSPPAPTSSPGGPSPLDLALLAAVVILVVGLMAVYALRRRRAP